MTDEALEMFETNEQADKAEAYDMLRRRASKLGYASVNDALDDLAGAHEDRWGTSELEAKEDDR